jgi:hypothetical protein
VAAGVVEVLAFQQDLGAAAIAFAVVAGLRDGCRTPGVVGAQIIQFGNELCVLACHREGLLQFGERRLQGLRHEPAPEVAIVAATVR